MLTELRKVIPSFLERVDRPERGGEWSRLPGRAPATPPPRWSSASGPSDAARPTHDGTAARAARGALVDFDPEGEDKVLAAICFAHRPISEAAACAGCARSAPRTARALLAAYVGERANRRHRPGRAFERTDYRFEIVTRLRRLP